MSQPSHLGLPSLPGLLRRAAAQPPGPEARLDELLRYEEDASPAGEPAGRRPWRLRALAQAFVLSAVLYTGFRAVGYAAPYPLVAAVAGGLVLVRQALVVVAEPAWPRPRDAVAARQAADTDLTDRPDPEDGLLSAVRRWERRLTWAVSQPERFAETLPGRLAELVDARLRQRHGITSASDPARARVLLGDAAWALLHEPAGQVPSARQLAAVVERMERL